MNLFLIRHARAVDGEGVPDAHRPLTARGRRDVEEVAEALRADEVRFDAIVMSPLVRAVETASLLAAGTRFEGGLAVSPNLALGRAPQSVVEEVILPRAASAGALALVGHEPQLGELLSALLHGLAPALAKCAVVKLGFDGPSAPARFKWVLRPGMKRPSKELADVG